MTDKFEPAPIDKHAADPRRSIQHNKKQDDELDKDLKDSFPASDPASSTQPSKETPDA